HLLPSSTSHRILPSFPTRRSSDLHRRPFRTRRVARRRPLRPRSPAIVALRTGANREDGNLAQTKATLRWKNHSRFALSTGLNLLDRKSTRLNSSHRTISYAVFCLK